MLQNNKKTPDSSSIVVLINNFSPFVIYSDNGVVGFDIDLWTELARRIGKKFKYQKASNLKDLFEKLHKKKADVGIAGLTITEERENLVDFSYPYFESGLVVVVKKNTRFRVITLFEKLFSKKIFVLVLSFVIGILVLGHILWFIESGDAVTRLYPAGIFELLWLIVATITTVGFGDVVPSTVLGRLIIMALMFFGVAMFGIFTAKLSSLITMEENRLNIKSYRDLEGKSVAVKMGTATKDFFKSFGIDLVFGSTDGEIYSFLRDEKVEAAILDAPSVKYYLTKKHNSKLVSVGDLFARQHYGIAFSKNSVLRKEINKALLVMEHDGTYDTIYKKWFGKDGEHLHLHKNI